MNNVYISGVGTGATYNNTVSAINITDTAHHALTANYTVAIETRSLYVRLDMTCTTARDISVDYVAVQYYYEDAF